jgi:hypothetical protein
MKPTEYQFYKVICHNCVKFIKTNSVNSKIILFEKGKPVIKDFNQPYPIWEHHDDNAITRTEFNQALEIAGRTKGTINAEYHEMV